MLTVVTILSLVDPSFSSSPSLLQCSYFNIICNIVVAPGYACDSTEKWFVRACVCVCQTAKPNKIPTQFYVTMPLRITLYWYGQLVVHIGVRANIHLGGQTEFCPNGFSGGGGVVAEIFRDPYSVGGGGVVAEIFQEPYFVGWQNFFR